MKQLYITLQITTIIIAVILGYFQIQEYWGNLSSDEIFYHKFLKISGIPIMLCYFLWTGWIRVWKKYFSEEDNANN
jgi:hypothetical protein